MTEYPDKVLTIDEPAESTFSVKRKDKG